MIICRDICAPELEALIGHRIYTYGCFSEFGTCNRCGAERVWCAGTRHEPVQKMPAPPLLVKAMPKRAHTATYKKSRPVKVGALPGVARTGMRAAHNLGEALMHARDIISSSDASASGK